MNQNLRILLSQLITSHDTWRMEVELKFFTISQADGSTGNCTSASSSALSSFIACLKSCKYLPLFSDCDSQREIATLSQCSHFAIQPWTAFQGRLCPSTRGCNVKQRWIQAGAQETPSVKRLTEDFFPLILYWPWFIPVLFFNSLGSKKIIPFPSFYMSFKGHLVHIHIFSEDPETLRSKADSHLCMSKSSGM